MAEYNLLKKEEIFFPEIVPELMNVASILSILPLSDLKGHSLRTSAYSNKLATMLGADTYITIFGGLLHDIGKIFAPVEILKSKNPLSYEERKEIDKHSINGMQFLSVIGRNSLPRLPEIMQIVGYHHKRYDGGGNPGLKLKDLPIEVGIVSLADSVDTMLSERGYKDAQSIEYVINEVEQNRGKQFHPEVADVFLHLIKNKMIVIDQSSHYH